ncbi:MAG: ribonuclease E/G [Parvularculaceae bacterium]
MTRRLFVACGAAETVAALVADGEIARFFFAPARGDETAPRRAETGDIVLGRIKASSPALGGVFIDIGSEQDGFAPLRRSATTAPEGATALFHVQRPAIGGKGAVLDPDWRRGLSPKRQASMTLEGPPRLLSQTFDPVLLVVLRAADLGPAEIIVDQPDAAHALAYDGVTASCDTGRVAALDLEGAIAAALESVVALGGGARMTIEETSGGCVVDVDAGPAAEASRKPNDAVNRRAAGALFGELGRRGIGGRVIVDFLPPSSPAARKALAAELENNAAPFERRLGKLAPDGLLDLTAPRRDFSLLERASAPASEGCIRAGRRLTLDWTARRAVAAIEGRLSRHPRLRVTLEAGAAIARYLADRPQWLGRLAERYGPRALIEATERPERTFDVRES